MRNERKGEASGFPQKGLDSRKKPEIGMDPPLDRSRGRETVGQELKWRADHRCKEAAGCPRAGKMMGHPNCMPGQDNVGSLRQFAAGG